MRRVGDDITPGVIQNTSKNYTPCNIFDGRTDTLEILKARLRTLNGLARLSGDHLRIAVEVLSVLARSDSRGAQELLSSRLRDLPDPPEPATRASEEGCPRRTRTTQEPLRRRM